jgi:hypothetical protein
MSVASIKRLTPFTPTQISGCQLWLDGADSNTLTLSGSSVTAWNDKSGNNYHMNTLTASARWTGTAVYPTIGTSINGLQTVNFLAQSGLKQGTTLDGVKNLFWVGRIAVPVGSGDWSLFLLGHDNTYDWHGNQYGNKFLYPGLTQTGILNASPTSLFTSDVNAIRDATFSNVNMPSAPNVSLLSVAGITGTTRYQGICYDRGDNIGWCGDLAEVIIFSTALSVSNRQTIEGYLAQKWGFTGSLPPFHPGLKSKIYPSIPQNRLFNLSTSSAFTPITITGCQLWLDGADPAGTGILPANGATVSTWADKSGNARNSPANTTGAVFAANSLNGRGTINFTAQGRYYVTPNFVPSSTNAPSIFVVAQQTGYTSGNSEIVIATVGSPTWATFDLFGSGGTFIARLNMYNNQGENGGISISSPAFISIVGSGAPSYSVSMFGNGTVNVTFTGNSGNPLSTSMGFNIGSSAGFIGNIYDVIMYNTTLSTLQRQQIEGYLAWKWGLQANLPADHPYKSAAPTSTSTAPARAIISLPRFQYSSSGLVITHLDGRSWKLSGSSIYLNTGTTMSLTIYAGSDVYNSANGRVGLFNNGSSSAAVRHSSYVMFADPFTPNNFDFAWYFVSSGSGYLIYNDYPSISAWQVSYDTGQDRVLITAPGNANYGMVWNITPKLTLSYVYRSYPT